MNADKRDDQELSDDELGRLGDLLLEKKRERLGDLLLDTMLRRLARDMSGNMPPPAPPPASRPKPTAADFERVLAYRKRRGRE